ncbi:MAG: cobamide remodeling phosphodiesterase CbiR [Nitrososphaerota archaeon]|nr:cobamide remodeling phosphodiesterase CbiR [Nitrososphaerota archaeon]
MDEKILDKLKIGIATLSFEGVMENLKLGIGETMFFNHMQLIKKLVENGFKHIELTADLYYILPESFSKDNIEELDSMRHDGVSFSVHLPLLSAELDSPIEEVRKASVSAVVKPAEILEELKPLIYVLHIAGPISAELSRMDINQNYKDVFFEILAKNTSKSVEQIVSYLSDIGIASNRIALESIEFPFLKTIEIADEYNTSICVDTGHILAGYSGKISVEEAIMKSSRRLGEIHLHDAYRRVGKDVILVKDHLPLGVGDLNVKSFLKTLAQVEFAGPMVFELCLRDAKISLGKLISCF